MELDTTLMLPHVTVADYKELFAKLAELLRAGGYVKDSYLDALMLREVDYPTGLLVPGGGVALPHTDATHVHKDTFAVVTLDEPIPFLPMGGETDEPVEVSTAIFLVFSDPTRHLSTLSSAVRAIQGPTFLPDLHAATTPEQLRDVLSTHLG